MADRIIQRVVFPAERPLHPLYYRLDHPRDGRLFETGYPDRFSIGIGPGSMLVTDTYFNSFYECYWRRYTRLVGLRLRLRLSGEGTVLLLRRSLATGLALLESVEFDDDRAEVVIDVPEPKVHFRELGALHFDVIARSSDVRLLGAEWLAEDAGQGRVGLVAGYCTFNREPFLLDNVRALLEDPAVAEILERIVVVDQGTSRVADHPGFDDLPASARRKLRVVEQGNFGGAGGFTRSIIEARSVAGATHMLLMDDDAVTEPESVFRAASFLALAREEIAVGGQMLDMLRRMDVYESGAMVDPGSLSVHTPVHRHSVEASASLAPFLEVAHTHYNAWWFFAFPLRLVDRVGLPLPLFIRGDDVEYGSRLHKAGIPTVTVPGLGVWHEPFYLKTGGWQPYYDLRNMLVLTAMHFPMPRLQVVKTLLRRLVKLLLALNYFEATIVCEAVDDFCKGPEILGDDPRAIHRKVLAIKKEMAPETIPRATCLPTVHPAAPPHSLSRRTRHFLRCVLWQAFRPSPPADAPPGMVIREEHARWWSLAKADVVAVADWYAEDHRVLRRSRTLLIRTLTRGLKSALRLYREHDRVGGEWRASFARLTSSPFWRQYLDLGRDDLDDASREDRTRHAA